MVIVFVCNTITCPSMMCNWLSELAILRYTWFQHITYRQEDAQEFLSFVMDQMHDELLKFEGQSSSLNGSRSSLVSSVEDDEWETVGPKNKSAVTRTQSFVPSELSGIFGGDLRSLVTTKGTKYNS